MSTNPLTIDDESREILDGLHYLDKSGQGFRYSTVKVGRGQRLKFEPGLPNLTDVDVDAVAMALQDAIAAILNGVGTTLYYYEQWQLDIAEEHAAPE